MAPKQKGDRWNRIPIKFLDSEGEETIEENLESVADNERMEVEDDMQLEGGVAGEAAAQDSEIDPDPQSGQDFGAEQAGGPLFAELVATRAELRRVEAENAELRDRLARRQADFENYRKRTERERSETYNRVVADIAAKLLPVLDNLKRALDAEASVEASESDEFRHFLSGVDLINKQLNGVIEALGVKAITAVGEQFNPHIHEAVVTEPTDEFEPDTVVQEIRTGYRLGDKLIRPALVKVAVRK